MKKYSVFYLVLCLSIVSVIIGCKDDDPAAESAIADGFSLENTTWFFQTVAASGTLNGTDLDDKDDMPDGFVTFNADGTGVFNFEISLLGRDYGKLDNVTWERTSNSEVTIVESDGDINIWTLVRANENVVEASWETAIGGDLGNAEFIAELTATE